MTQSDNPPIVVGIVGAYIGLEQPQIIIALIGLLVSYIILKVVSKYVRTKIEIRNQKLERHQTLNARIASKYYRSRAQILSKLGLIGR